MRKAAIVEVDIRAALREEQGGACHLFLWVLLRRDPRWV